MYEFVGSSESDVTVDRYWKQRVSPIGGNRRETITDNAILFSTLNVPRRFDVVVAVTEFVS